MKVFMVLESNAGDDEARVIRTLRYLLKRLLRTGELRCVELRQMTSDNDGGER